VVSCAGAAEEGSIVVLPRAVAFLPLLSIAGWPLPSAAAWQFVNVLDSTGPYAHFTPPGINASGQVAFRATLDAGGQAILSGDAGGVDTVATTAGPYSVFLTQVSIGDDGTVVFNAELDAFGTGTFVGPDPVTDTIASTNDGFLFVDLPAVDTAGNVVLSGGIGSTRGIYSGETPIADNTGELNFFGRPAINDAGTVAFQASFDGNAGTGVFTVPLAGGSAPATLADTDGPFNSIDQFVSINDAGEVAFVGVLDAGGVKGIYTGPDPVADKVVDVSGPYDDVSNPAIAEDGSVTFSAFTATTGGIYRGPDPAADKVIQGFDPLFGSTLGTAQFRSEGYSNGRIAFSYFLTDGREGIAVAFVPEPAVGTGAGAAGLALLALGGRRSGRSA
jgi:hypothetical protein